ncbi:MAG: hypothetical protein R3E89_11435 [Thiolinea sp.]
MLRDQFEAGTLDAVLTTERRPRPGGMVINTQALVWVGRKQGNAQQRPLPIGLSQHCAFRPAVVDALEQAGIAQDGPGGLR